MKWLLSLVLVLLAVGALRVVGCGDDLECTSDEDCDDGNECTFEDCRASYGCWYEPVDDGTRCGNGRVCWGGVCTEDPCVACEDDGNECTYECEYEIEDGPQCGHFPVLDGNPCQNGTGRCYSGECCIEDPACDDDDQCTKDCKVAETEECVSTPWPDGTLCQAKDRRSTEVPGVCVERRCRFLCYEKLPCNHEDEPCLTGECVSIPDDPWPSLRYCSYHPDGQACGDSGQCIDGFCVE